MWTSALYWRCSHTHTHIQSSERSDTQTDRQADGEQRQRLCAGTDLKSWSWCSRSSTDLRLPWLDRERGSCFMHGQKESSEREGDAPSLNCGGRSHRPQRQISILLCKGGGGGGGRAGDGWTVKKEPQGERNITPKQTTPCVRIAPPPPHY